MKTLQAPGEDPSGFGFVQGLLQLQRPLLEGLFQLGYLLCQAVDVTPVRIFPLLQHGHVALLGGGPAGPQRRLTAAGGRWLAGQQVDQGHAAAQAQDDDADVGDEG